jgi:hypothetical protein
MGYAVKNNPNGLVSKFKLYLRTKRLTQDGTYKRDDKYVPPGEYKLHGFSTELSFEEAQKRASDLNAQAEVKRYAAKKADAAERVREEAKAFEAFVTDEEEFLKYAEANLRFASIKSNKFQSHWHRTKAMIAELKLTPPEFEDNARKIYRYFADRAHAIGYCQKLLRCLNLYGKFYAKRYKVYVAEVPYPSGYDKSDIEDAYFEANPDGGESKPLSPALLAKLKDLPEEQYNWMHLSMWLGLRPNEVDLLKKSGQIKWETVEGVTVLWVMQDKLKKLPRPKRWKLIPFVEPEQADLKALIESGKFERPLVKNIAARIGDGYTLYAGRKGFEDLMMTRGHAFDHVSQWLGHQSLNRTWNNYVDRTKVRFKKRA